MLGENFRLVEKDIDDVICNCMQITRGEIIEAISDGGLKTIDAIGEEIEAGTVCESCHDDIQDILNEYYKNN